MLPSYLLPVGHAASSKFKVRIDRALFEVIFLLPSSHTPHACSFLPISAPRFSSSVLSLSSTPLYPTLPRDAISGLDQRNSQLVADSLARAERPDQNCFHRD